MPQTSASRYCHHCQDRTLAIKNTPNHVLHLILSVCTAGVWLLVWGGLMLFNLASPYRCNRCGTAV